MMIFTISVLRQQRIERERQAAEEARQKYITGLQDQCIQLLAKARRRGSVEIVRMLEHIEAMLRREPGATGH